ncbi:MAG: heavy metal translocating P-type ATPase, partial [Oscillospiraceae bacterium]|nr:heavy metal translocating P-type ATPase [Oscillospiraceae bacterium]
MKQKFTVTGMSCSACVAHVERAVKKLPGVTEVQVNLLAGSMVADYEENQVNVEEIVAAVRGAGYGAALSGSKQQKEATRRPDEMLQNDLGHMKQRLIVSFVFLIPLFYLAMGHMLGFPIPNFFHGTENAPVFALTQFLLVLPIAYWNDKYYKVGFRSLFRGAPNMDSLIAIGSGAALVYGVFALYRMGWGAGHGDMDVVSQYAMDVYFESAGMILTLVTLGKYLETKAKGRTSEAIFQLMDLVPKTATVLRQEAEVEIPVEEVQTGDILVLRSGQSVPVDGVILEGTAAIDESALTGESMPVEKQVGDMVYSATINQSGFIQFRASKVGDDTVLSQIIRLVEEAGASKAPIAKLADRVAGVFVPIVIGIAVLAAVIWLLAGQTISFALSIGISVLVISCPCALGLATPVAIMVGIGKGAEHEILIKSAESLEMLHQVQTIVVDKTGTITEGKPQVTHLLPGTGVQEEQLLRFAASIEALSNHPLANAICEEAERRNLPLLPAVNFQAEPGRGIVAAIGNISCFAGNAAMMTEKGIVLEEAILRQSEALEQEGKTMLYFGGNERLIGAVAVADVVKESSRTAIATLREMGLDVIMLTGDHQRTAEAIGRELDLTSVIAGVMPADKERVIAQLQSDGKKVAMVGDGINDAPALTRAEVGLAVGAGTDVAIESADIVLMRSDLNDVAGAVQLSKSVIRNIKQNLFWAFFYNCIGIPVAAGILYPIWGITLNPMIAAAAMSLSSVCVVSNALRLKRFHFSQGKGGQLLTEVHTEKNAPTQQSMPLNLAPQELSMPGHQKGEIQMKQQLKIEGMSCKHCSARVEKVLSEMDGVSQVMVDLDEKTATVTLNKPIERSAFEKTIADAGYQVVDV